MNNKKGIIDSLDSLRQCTSAFSEKYREEYRKRDRNRRIMIVSVIIALIATVATWLTIYYF